MSSQMTPTAKRSFLGSISGDRRPMLAVGGAVVVAMLAVAMYVLFFSGSGSDSLSGPVALPMRTGTPIPTVTPQITAVAVSGTRDPFAITWAVATSQAAPVPAAGSTVAPTVAPSPTATGTPFVVKLVALTPTTATVLVNNHSFTPTLLSTFATYFRLYMIFGNTCAGFQYKTSQSVALCVGDSAVLAP